MSENIAGYIDRSCIKGQTYRYAATPKPMVFTGNIDEISDSNLLSKAMLVTKGQTSGGTLPTIGDVFLVTTIKYGDSIYLQTAYLVQSGYECWEYRRIYSSGWTEWIGVDSKIKAVDDKVQESKDIANEAKSAIVDKGGINDQISKINSDIKTINTNKLPAIDGDITSIKGRLDTIEDKNLTKDISSQYTITKISGHWSIVDYKIYRNENVINMFITFNGDGSSIGSGVNGYRGQITGTGPLPLYKTQFIIGAGSDNPITICATISTDGEIYIKNNGPYNKTFSSSNRVDINGTFLVSSNG